MSFQFCPLTGMQLSSIKGEILPTTAMRFDYSTPLIGKAYIALPTYQVWEASRDFKHPELAGICRNAFEDGIEPPIIDSNYISNVKNLSIPRTIREKNLHLLKYMYKRGGKELQEFSFFSSKDYPIAYAESDEEFNKIMKYLERQSFIRIGSELPMAMHMSKYDEVTLTSLGIIEAEKELPAIPLVGLVQQEIATGDNDVDAQISHARKLFFEEPATMEKMRSACESLSYVLEPLRNELKSHFSSKDIEAFFILVNNFDIRHNKEHTKSLVYPEQLEWVFYSLLNTINTYVKLKKRANE